jgi:hypothetical protein
MTAWIITALVALALPAAAYLAFWLFKRDNTPGNGSLG